jgi:hypothetical protein
MDNIKRIMQGFKRNKATDFIPEEEQTLIEEEEQSEDELIEDEDQSAGAI